MQAREFFLHQLLQGEGITGSEGLPEFTTTWVAKAGPHPQEQEGNFSHWQHHRAMLPSEEGGPWSAVRPQNHLPTIHREQEGLRERGTLPGEELPWFLTKQSSEIQPNLTTDWLVLFPLYKEATGKVTNGILIRRESIQGKDLSTLRPPAPAHMYACASAAGATVAVEPLIRYFTRPSTQPPLHSWSPGDPLPLFMPLCSAAPRPRVCDDLGTCFSY